MLRSFVINKYIGKEFLKVVLNVTFVLSCVSFVLNLFEEINFFKDYNVGFDLPIIMSLLFVPNLVYNIFLFVILLSGIWFFLKIKKNDEIIAMKSSGMSNLSLITVIGSISLVLGIILVTAINPIISSLVTKY